MKFYKFEQNNSGGHFHIDLEDGINQKVFIEAKDENEALDRANMIGVYFNGVKKGIDCDCCGDRWDSFCDEIETEHMISLDDIGASIHYYDGRIVNI